MSLTSLLTPSFLNDLKVVHKEETKTWKDQAHILRYFLNLNFPNFTKLLLICFAPPPLLEPESSPSLELRVGCWHFGLFFKRAIHPCLPLWHPSTDESKSRLLQNSWHFGYVWLFPPHSVSVLKSGSQILGQFLQGRVHLQVLNEIRLLLRWMGVGWSGEMPGGDTQLKEALPRPPGKLVLGSPQEKRLCVCCIWPTVPGEVQGDAHASPLVCKSGKPPSQSNDSLLG